MKSEIEPQYMFTLSKLINVFNPMDSETVHIPYT